MSKNVYFINKAMKKSGAKKVVFLTELLEDTDELYSETILINEHLKYDSEQYKMLRKNISDIKNNVLLIAKSAYMYIVNRLIWECENVKGVYYVDTKMPYQIEEKVTFKDKLLWDVQANNTETQPAMSGWFNSYDNRQFTKEELDDYVNNSKIKLMPYITSKTKVLEVGVGSGMLAFNIAPLCKQYDGCDISNIVLDKLRNMASEKNINNINLFQCAADEIDKINQKYNIILMSSVTEYFSGYNYLRKVVEKCIETIDEKGVILFADVFDLAKKESYRSSVYRYAKENPGVRYKKDFSHELFVPREYWKDIANIFDEVSRVIVSDKMGIIKNEINTFLYDVILEVDKTKNKEQLYNREHYLYKYQFGLETV